MTEFEKKTIEQNEKMLKNQETIIEMLYLSPFLPMGGAAKFVAFAEPYYKHHNMPLEPLHQLLEESEEPHEKQHREREFSPIGVQS